MTDLEQLEQYRLEAWEHLHLLQALGAILMGGLLLWLFSGCEHSRGREINADRPEVVAAGERCLDVIEEQAGASRPDSVTVHEIPVSDQNAAGQGRYPYKAGEWAHGWTDGHGSAWVSYPADTTYRHVLLHELQHLCGLDADSPERMARLQSDTRATR